jgi:hypothetical protein
MPKITRLTTLSLLSLTAALAWTAGPAGAVETSTTSVRCSSVVKLQDRIDRVRAGTVATFNVSGTCNENLVISHGKTVIIKGSSGAKITPRDPAASAITSEGNATIENMVIENANGSAYDLVNVTEGGFLKIAASTLTAPNTEYIVAISDNSSSVISNSRLTGGSVGGVDMWKSGVLEVFGHPGQTPGPDGAKTVISSPNDSGDGVIGCGLGSTLHIVAQKSGTQSGAVLIKDGRIGINAGVNCTVYLNNKTSDPENLKITNTGDRAIVINHSTMKIKSASITGNKGDGIESTQSTIAIGGSSSISGNLGERDIAAGPGSNIFINGWDGKSSLTDAFDQETLQCWYDGKIFIDENALNIPAGSTFDALREINPCVNQ